MRHGGCHTTDGGATLRTGPGTILGTFAGGEGVAVRDGVSTGLFVSEFEFGCCRVTLDRPVCARAALETNEVGRVIEDEATA